MDVLREVLGLSCAVRRLASTALLVAVCAQPAIAASDVAPPPAAAGACDEIGLTKGDYLGDRSKLRVVEEYHFKPHTESLVRRPGDSSQSIGADLSYTLRSFPNHHRALNSMMRLAEKSGREQPDGADRPVECFLKRAVRFRPDDTVARMLYVTYLVKKARKDEAMTQLSMVEQHARDNAFSLYNAGLLYTELQEWDLALSMAHRAQAMGFPRTQLQESLLKAGKWRDPSPEAAAGPASASSVPATPAAAPAASD
jgi:hypothetical protein